MAIIGSSDALSGTRPHSYPIRLRKTHQSRCFCLIIDDGRRRADRFVISSLFSGHSRNFLCRQIFSSFLGSEFQKQLLHDTLLIWCWCIRPSIIGTSIIGHWQPLFSAAKKLIIISVFAAVSPKSVRTHWALVCFFSPLFSYCFCFPPAKTRYRLRG